MKKILLHIGFLLLPAIVVAQSFDTSRYAFVNRVGDGLYLIGVGGNPAKGDFKNTKIGFAAENGQILLEPIYSEIGEFVNGLAFIRNNDKYGYIDDRFNIIIPCVYSGVGAFNEYGLVWVNQGGSTKDVPGRVSGGKFGVLDYQGRVVVPVKYKAIGTFLSQPSELGDITRIDFVSTNPTLKKYAKNYQVYDYSYHDGTIMQSLDMRQGPFVVCSPGGNRSGDGIVDASGRVVLPEGKFSSFFCPSNGFIPLKLETKGQMCTNYFNMSNGSLVLNSWVPVQCITPFTGNYTILTVKDKSVVIDYAGRQITGETYKIVLPSDTGTFVTANANGFGMIDAQGREIFPCCFSFICPETEGLFLIQERKQGLCGYINASGDYVIKPKYIDGYPFKDGHALVKGVAGWGMIDKEGKSKLECLWKSIIIPVTDNPDKFWVKPFNETDFICIDAATQTPSFPTSYRYIYTNFDDVFDGVSVVGRSCNNCGIVAKDGMEVVPTIMGSVEEAKDIYKTMLRDGRKVFAESDIWRYRLKKRERSLRHSLNVVIDANNWDY